MKVVYLSDSYFPSTAANSVHIIKMCEALSGNGHDVTMVGMSRSITFDRSRIFNQYGVNSSFKIKLNFVPAIPGALFINAFWNVLNMLSMRPNLVIGRSYVSAAIISMFYNLNIIFETHTPYEELDSLRKWAFKRIAKNAKLIVVISDALKQMLLAEDEKYKLKMPPIKVHHDAATESRKDYIDEKRFTVGTSLKVGYIGTINAGRGIEQLLSVSRELPGIEFHVVGGGLEDLQNKLGINDVPANFFCHGYISPKQSAYYRDNMDILVAPYQENTSIKSSRNTSAYMSPLKIFEYMSAAKAIVASDLPVIREVLNDSNSILVKPDDISGWTSAIKRLKDDETRRSLAMQALQDFRKNYTWKKRCERIIDEFHETCNVN